MHNEKESDWITLKGSKNKILNNYFEGKTALHRNSEIEILYNLFINMDAEPELISVKSSNTLLKGNTVISSIAGITLRQGRDNVVDDMFL